MYKKSNSLFLKTNKTNAEKLLFVKNDSAFLRLCVLKHFNAIHQKYFFLMYFICYIIVQNINNQIPIKKNST